MQAAKSYLGRSLQSIITILYIVETTLIIELEWAVQSSAAIRVVESSIQLGLAQQLGLLSRAFN